MRRIVAILVLVVAAIPLPAASRKYIVEFSTATAAAQSAGRQRFHAAAASVAVVRHEFARLFPGAAVELRNGQTAAALARLPNVIAVYPDGEVSAFAGSTHAASRASRPALSPRTSAGGGVVVAVIDTGVDGTHPALAGKVIGGYDFVNGDDDPMDDNGHGTHVTGIIAAQSPTMTGVAPGVKILAYKVLNQNGSGTFSDIIAALERALSDHAAVANLSLGGIGSPDDPLARAVDNAVAAGMIVCAASGNDGSFHHIGTPGGAARAITVGASGMANGAPTVALFTTRGPAPLTGAVKPDVLAPGVDVRSTYLEHGFAVLSGTSMATPYVAGLAALLVEEHSGWSPERIKAALMGSAHPIAAEDVMTQGGGVVDLGAAQADALFASPTALNFGLDGGRPESGDWSEKRRFTLRNDGSAARSVHIAREATPAAVDIAVSPERATLAPGESVEVEATVTAHNAALAKPEGSFCLGGRLLVTAGGEEVRVPWAFVHAARAVINDPGALLDVSWQSAQTLRVSPVRFGAGGLEYLIEPGVVDFFISASANDDLQVAVAEGKEVVGEVDIELTAADTRHEIRLSSIDETGAPLPLGDGTNSIHVLLPRLLLPDGRAIPLMQGFGRVVHTATLAERYGLLISEGFVSEGGTRAYIAQYPLLRGVSGDRALEISPADYAVQPLEVRMPPSQQQFLMQVAPIDVTSNSISRSIAPRSIFFDFPGGTWRSTLYMTKEVDPGVASMLSILLWDPQFPTVPTLIGPGIHRTEHGFFTTNGYVESALPMRLGPGDPLSLGGGPVHMPYVLQASAKVLSATPLLSGDRGEGRLGESYLGTAEVRNESGVLVAKQPVQTFMTLSLPGAGRYTATLFYPTLALGERTAAARLTATFDTRPGDLALSTITSLMILDEAGRHTTKLTANGNGAVVFSATGIAADRTKVFYRRHKTDAWSPITAVITGEDNPIGLIYRADLREALRGALGECEIAIEVADTRGNTVRLESEPAFVVEPEHVVPRRRAVGR